MVSSHELPAPGTLRWPWRHDASRIDRLPGRHAGQALIPRPRALPLTPWLTLCLPSPALMPPLYTALKGFRAPGPWFLYCKLCKLWPLPVPPGLHPELDPQHHPHCVRSGASTHSPREAQMDMVSLLTMPRAAREPARTQNSLSRITLEHMPCADGETEIQSYS